MNFIVAILVFVVGWVYPQQYKGQLSRKDLVWLRLLWLYHIVFGVYYCFFVQGDATGYWAISKSLNIDDVWNLMLVSRGTIFMHVFNYFPAHVLDLSYFAGTMIYCCIGFMGLTYFYVIAKKTIPFNSTFRGLKLFPLLFFSPNLHFWSVAVGKDTLIFYFIGLFVYGLLELNKRIPQVIISLILTYAIRPHITLFLLVAFTGAYIVSSKISLVKRVLLGIVLLAIGLAILPSVMAFAKIEDASVEGYEQFSMNKATVLSRSTSGSAIDVSNYPYLLKLFTFLYRPLFIDGYSVPALLASFENLLLLLLSIQVLRQKPIATFKLAPFVLKGLLIFLVLGALIFAGSLGNIGIMIRMRNMLLPGMLIYIMWSFSLQISTKRARMLKRKKLFLTQAIIENP